MLKLPNSYMSKYKMRMFSYRTKSFLRDIVGGRGGGRRARAFSAFAILALVLLIVSISVYGLNLKGGAQGETQISTDIIAPVYYDGVSIHTKARNTSNPNAAYSATAKKDDIVLFTLTVSNNSAVATPTDIKFTLPAGFSYNGGMTYDAKITGCANSSIVGDTSIMNWAGCIAQPGDSVIEFNTKAS